MDFSAVFMDMYTVALFGSLQHSGAVTIRMCVFGGVLYYDIMLKGVVTTL